MPNRIVKPSTTSAQANQNHSGPSSRSSRSGANKVGEVNAATPKRGSMPRAEDNSIQARHTRRILGIHEAVKGYLAKLDRTNLTERDLTRLSDLVEFAVNLGYAGDI